MLRKKRLGDRLVEAGIIDKLQLRAALGQQSQWGKTLGRTLLEMRLVSEEELIPILSDQLNMPAIDLKGRQLDLEAVAMVSEEFCRENECIPFGFDEKGRFLDVAMTDAQNSALYDRVRVQTRCNVRPFLAGPDAIRNAIDRAYGEDLAAMKLQFMLTENVFDFGEEGGEGDELETALDVGRRRSMGIDPAMAQDAPEPEPASSRRPTSSHYPAAAPERRPSGVMEARRPSATMETRRPSGMMNIPQPSASAAVEDEEDAETEPPAPDEAGYEDEPYDEEPYEEESYEEEGYSQDGVGFEEEGYSQDGTGATVDRLAALEDRMLRVEDQLRRQDLYVRGLVDQMRELFGQLARNGQIRVGRGHPLVPATRGRRSPSRSGLPQQGQPRGRRPTRPEQATGQEPRQRRVTRPEMAASQQPPPRQRRVTRPEIAPPGQAAPEQPRSAPPRRMPRTTEPVEPVSIDIDMDGAEDGDDDVEFVPGTGRLVETPRRPEADAVRPTPPRQTSGAEPTMPLVDLPPGSQSVVAIDLGTTRSSVATVIDGQVSVLKLPGGEWDIPSVVGFREDGSVMLGKSARMMLANEPDNVIASPKRLLGHRFDEMALQPYLAQLSMKNFAGPRDDVMLECRGRPLGITEVCAHILNLLRLVAERSLKRKVEQVILTTPVSFNDRQYGALATAAQLAGLEVLEFVPEPVAATLSCVSDPNCRGLVAVYDFGGGTFDFSVVDVGQETMEVVVTSGDGWLGGDDFDEALAGAAANAFWQQTQIELRNQVTHWQRLLVRSEMTKRRLTEEEEATLRLPGAAVTAQGELDLVYPISRQKFASLARGIIRRSLETCRAALDSQKLTVKDLNAVYLSGGTTYIPAVRQAVAEYFQTEPRTVVPPERAVLVGAAVHGALFHREAAAAG